MSVVLDQDSSAVILYSYWRSSCSWRVRIALYFKGIPFEYRPVDLLKNEQTKQDYEEFNAGGLVPTLIIDKSILTQSVAMLEYLEERRPETWRLMPQEATQRAQVRSLVMMIAADIQPIQNLRVLRAVGDERKASWGKHWISVGFEAVERVLEKTAGKYCFGDQVTLADVCLVPQVYNAKRFAVDMSKFPLICRINEALEQIPAFQKAHPDNQPDAPKPKQ